MLDPCQGRQFPPGLCALAVMTKAPRAGKVKTRLTPPLTPDEASALHACFIRDATTALGQVARGGRSHGICVFTPTGEESTLTEMIPPQFELMPQRGEELGERVIFAAEDLFTLGFNAVCLINGDSPTVPVAAYEDAVRLLSQPSNQIVLGPAADGGYYLVGLKKMQRRLFTEIAWSTENVLKQTMERATEIGVGVELLTTWYDVDDKATLQRLCAELLSEEKVEPPGYVAHATRQFLSELIAREGRERIWPLVAA